MSRDQQHLADYLAHGYFKVDLEIVWKTIHRDLPGLYQQIKELFRWVANNVMVTPKNNMGYVIQ